MASPHAANRSCSGAAGLMLRVPSCGIDIVTISMMRLCECESCGINRPTPVEDSNNSQLHLDLSNMKVIQQQDPDQLAMK